MCVPTASRLDAHPNPEEQPVLLGIRPFTWLVYPQVLQQSRSAIEPIFHFAPEAEVSPVHHKKLCVPEKLPPTAVPLIVSVLLSLHTVLTLPHSM